MKKYFTLLIQLIHVCSTLAQLSPGDLSKSHHHLEGMKNCTKCHELGEKVLPAKCLDCHNILKDRIREGKGLHAKNDYSNCSDCHSDHQGLEFDLIWWKEGKDKFDHTITGYTLEGKHQSLDCRKCHSSENIADKQKYLSQNKNLNRTYLGLNSDCLSCHHNEHRGQLDSHCLKCHDLNVWKPAPLFDHNQAKFALRGKHSSVKCIFCHKKIEDKSNDRDKDYLKFTGLKFNNCSGCHRDPHQGRLGPSCTKCHTLSGWKGVVVNNFNHDRTRFPLRGKHRGITCKKCHNSSKSFNKSGFSQCRNCHNDYHQGQFYHKTQKRDCEECHSVEGFLPAKFTIIKHNTTKYPLIGAHLAVPCNLCHQKNYRGTTRYHFSSTECQSCHRDPHNREAELYVATKTVPEGKKGCQYCHSLDSWASIDFNHTQTNFQLEGKHQSIACKSCHKYAGTDPNISVLLKLNKNECQDCHHDIHMGQFLSKVKKDINNKKNILCDNCHTTYDWTASKFDHNLNSSFKLEGAHKNLNCSQCHKTVTEDGTVFVKFKPLSSSCSACHVNRSMEQ